MLTLKQVLPHFGNKNTNLAKALEISKQAVGKWPDGVLPEAQELKVRYVLLPDINFDKGSTVNSASQ